MAWLRSQPPLHFSYRATIRVAASIVDAGKARSVSNAAIESWYDASDSLTNTYSLYDSNPHAPWLFDA